MPASSLTRVPAFAQSIARPGAFRPPRPFPKTRSVSAPCSYTSTPSARTAAIVASVSAERPKPEIRVSPSQIAPISTDRCEIDLSPGTATCPTSRGTGSTKSASAPTVTHRLPSARPAMSATAVLTRTGAWHRSCQPTTFAGRKAPEHADSRSPAASRVFHSTVPFSQTRLIRRSPAPRPRRSPAARAPRPPAAPRPRPRRASSASRRDRSRRGRTRSPRR